MALPSTRRPAIVEEELEEASKNLLKIKLQPKKIFMGTMVNWYAHLSDRSKKRLTPRKLKKQAINVLFKINYAYERLPLNWVQELMDLTADENALKEMDIEIKTPMKLYIRNKKAKGFSFVADKEVNVTFDPLSFQAAKGKKLKTKIDNKSGNVAKEDAVAKIKDGEVTKKDHPFIDLRNEPPPAFWLEAYKNGQHLPRALSMSCTKERTIVFYDYSPKYKGDPLKNFQQRVHDGNSFDWFSNMVKEDDEPESDSD